MDVPILKVRNILRRWARRQPAEQIAKAEKLPQALVRRVIAKLREQGYITSEVLSDSGREFVRAKCISRVPKDQAQKMLDTYLDRCAEVNTRTEE